MVLTKLLHVPGAPSCSRHRKGSRNSRMRLSSQACCERPGRGPWLRKDAADRSPNIAHAPVPHTDHSALLPKVGDSVEASGQPHHHRGRGRGRRAIPDGDSVQEHALPRVADVASHSSQSTQFHTRATPQHPPRRGIQRAAFGLLSPAHRPITLPPRIDTATRVMLENG